MNSTFMTIILQFHTCGDSQQHE